MGNAGKDRAGKDRIAMRRAAFDLKEDVIGLAAEVALIDTEAHAALTKARLALFEAWTMLCRPPEDEGDEPHDH